VVARSALSSEFLADGSVARPSDPLADDTAVRADLDARQGNARTFTSATPAGGRVKGSALDRLISEREPGADELVRERDPFFGVLSSIGVGQIEETLAAFRVRKAIWDLKRK
jgi:hypothetical protein